MTSISVGDEFGYISQQREPRVLTGWGKVEQVFSPAHGVVRWSNDPNNPMTVTFAYGEIRRG